MTEPLKKILRVAAIGHEYKHAAGRKERLTENFTKKVSVSELTRREDFEVDSVLEE